MSNPRVLPLAARSVLNYLGFVCGSSVNRGRMHTDSTLLAINGRGRGSIFSLCSPLIIVPFLLRAIVSGTLTVGNNVPVIDS